MLIFTHDRKDCRKCNDCKLNAVRSAESIHETTMNFKQRLEHAVVGKAFVYDNEPVPDEFFGRLSNGNTPRRAREMWNRTFCTFRALRALNHFVKAAPEKKAIWAKAVARYTFDAPQNNIAFWLGVCGSCLR